MCKFEALVNVFMLVSPHTYKLQGRPPHNNARQLVMWLVENGHAHNYTMDVSGTVGGWVNYNSDGFPP